jgi:ABC-type cobalamin/Fe3+-siderophores transport system ATPase subunit
MLRFEVSNFRGYGDARPARFVLGDGFTAFIGLNNSGKSSLLRMFFELRQLFGVMGGVSEGLRLALNGIPNHFNLQAPVAEPPELFNNVSRRPIKIRVALDPAPEQVVGGAPPPSAIELELPYATQTFVARVLVDGAVVEPTSDIGFAESDGRTCVVRSGLGIFADMTDYMLAFRELENSLYIGAFRNAINAGAGSYYDLEVGSGFVDAWDVFKTGSTRANTEAALAVTDVIREIFGFDSLELNADRGGTNLQVVVNGRPYLLHELGGGLAHFIVVLAYIATREPQWLFIDEPELNLHPSLQLEFLLAVAAQTKQGVAFASHSVGLARAGADRTYAVRRIEDGSATVDEIEKLPRLSEFLGELSFGGYQDLGFGAVLLVEGQTDVRTFQQLLKHYGAEHEALVMPLGGSGSINGEVGPELEELRRITSALFAVVDSERTAASVDPAAAIRDFASACDAAGVECLILERRAIENYFTDAVVVAELGDGYRAPTPYEDFKTVVPRWNKRDKNWRIARRLTRSDLDATDLGPFLERVVEAAKPA